MHRLAMVGRILATAVVVVVGAGACAFAPSRDGAQGGQPAPVTAAGVTGASAPPGPSDQQVAAQPTAAPTAAPQPEKQPATTPTKKPVTPPKKKPGCPTGDRQRQVESALAALGTFGPVTVDGKQSDADCAAIKKFQKRYGISPAEGRAGPTTAGVAKRLVATDTGRCKAGKGLTFCVDLTNQTVYAIRDGKVVVAPTVTRTGMSGFATATGHFTVNWRNIEEWSNPYEVWLPYWQHFTQGMGFHQTTTYLHDSGIGSHGCVNLLPRDARTLWKLGKVGTKVHVFGHRAGT